MLWQAHAEAAAVAEVLHFKIAMLLLHQQRFEEAAAQFRTHLATFQHPPGERAQKTRRNGFLKHSQAFEQKVL